MTKTPCEGIFYVVRLPDGWRLMPLRFKKGEDVGHTDWWEESLGRIVAESWAVVLGADSCKLANELALLPYAFPRGRVTKAGRNFRIHHGSDIIPAMQVSRSMIEETFGVAGKCSWRFDEHERCQEIDRAALCERLRIADTWGAV